MSKQRHRGPVRTTRRGLAKWHAGIKTTHWEQLLPIPLSAISRLGVGDDNMRTEVAGVAALANRDLGVGVRGEAQED